MDILFSSDQFQIKPHLAAYFREELFVSAADARSAGLSASGQFGILAIEPFFPGPPEKRFAVRISVDPAVDPGNVRANQNFLDSAGFRPNDERFWSIRSASAIVTVTNASVELVVEQGNLSREIDALRRERRELFDQRCLLVETGCGVGSLSLPAAGRGYFNFRYIQPSPETLSESTILVLDETTTLNLFVPHRKGGVDMVLVIDTSGSMDLCDYVSPDNRPRSRLDGVRAALEVLLQRRLASGSRVSKVAAVVFGANTRMLYPSQEAGMVELKSEAQVEEMRAGARNLSRSGLSERLKVDRSKTDISGALQYAAELLDYYSQEGNEKMLVLLSDGADWTEDTEGSSKVEVVSTAHDPAVLADSLHFDSQIRIHTVAISTEQALRQHEDRKYWKEGWAIPNTTLLKKIADFTDGLFFEGPDARVLAKLFDEIGEGIQYPL